MRGFYFNVNNVDEICTKFSKVINQDAKVRSVGKWNAIVPKKENNSYVVDNEGNEIFIYGWITYNGRINPLKEVLSDFVRFLGNAPDFYNLKIDSGSFLILIKYRGKEYAITDPWGFAPHFARYEEDKILQIAPTPAFIKHGASVNPICESILKKKNHLFGDLTMYNEIKRLTPGSIIEIANGKKFGYFKYIDTHAKTLDAAMSRFNENYGFGDIRDKSVLPLSGGLDSRIILGVHDFAYGYTFGPIDTGDRPVARKFSHLFDTYEEFSFKALTYHQEVKDYAHIIFDGICIHPFAELIEVYKKIKQSNPKGEFFYDGYLGGAVHQGTYFYHTSFIGNLEKIFVSRIYKSFTPIKMLKERYAKLNQKELSLLISEYRSVDFIHDMQIPDTHKFLLFEILYGRGARYILNGGTIMASQFYTVIQPFFQNKWYFNCLMQKSAKEMLQWKMVKPVYKKFPDLFSTRTDTGYFPQHLPFYSRVIMMGNKFLSKLNIIKGCQNYTTELPEIVWEKSEKKVP